MFSDGPQYTDGIVGALIVYPTAAPPANFPTWDYDLVVQVSDWYHTLATILEEQFLSVRPPVLTVGSAEY